MQASFIVVDCARPTPLPVPRTRVPLSTPRVPGRCPPPAVEEADDGEAGSFHALTSARGHQGRATTVQDAAVRSSYLVTRSRPEGCTVAATPRPRRCRRAHPCPSLLDGPLSEVIHADGAEDLPIHALAAYAGPVRALVLGWKNGGREDLAEVMHEAGQRAAGLWTAGLETSLVREVTQAGRLLVVPAPSGLTRRLRGRLVAADLADAVARGIARSWPGQGDLLVACADVLRRRPQLRGAHQSGGSARRRRSNRASSPRVLAPVEGWPVLLVDDVVTTGSTLGSCARALEAARARCLGAVVLAAAPSPRAQATAVPGGPAPSRLSRTRPAGRVSAHGDQAAGK